jgi:hypothetical protein
MSIYSHVWLGSENDPQPVFRDETPEAFDWPEGAVMAVAFTREAFPNLENVDSRLPRTDFFSINGFPIDIDKQIATTLSEEIKTELQVYPWNWRRWFPEDWEPVINSPKILAHTRALSPFARAVATITQELAP